MIAGEAWRGRWVWASDAPEDTRVVVLLRQDLDLAVVPDQALARIAAVGRYRLLVNGVEVMSGPPRTNPRRAAWDELDLTPYLRPGRVALALQCWSWQGPMPWWHPLPGLGNPLTRGAVAFELGDLTQTDAGWRARAVTGWSTTPAEDSVLGRGVEQLDARTLPGDWATSAADWPAAVEISPRAPGAKPRSTPPSYPLGPVMGYPTVASREAVEPLVETAGGWKTTDGALVVGSLRLTVEGPAGATVRVHVAERLDGSGTPLPGRHDALLEATCDGSVRTLASLDVYGLAGAEVTALDGARVTAMAVDDRTRAVVGNHDFACSDGDLERIWLAGRRTVTLCSLDTYVDCPTREQRAWVGDAVVHQLVDLATNDDWGLPRWYPLMAASPRADGMLPMVIGGDAELGDSFVIADWALHWVHAVHTLYRYTGELDPVSELLPVVEGVLRWFARQSVNGLPTDLVGGVLIDWAAVRTDGASAALAGLYGRGLLELADLATSVGDHGRVAWARAQHHELRAGFEAFWQGGAYRDALLDGAVFPTMSQHTHAAAIVGGLVPADRLADVVSRMTDERRLLHASFAQPDGPAVPNSELDGSAYLASGPPAPWWDTASQVVRAQPFFRYVVHDALDLAGRRDLLAGLCRDWTVALDRNPHTLGETWYGGTTCHGWSATPTRDLTTRVLGIEPARPGFSVARIDPSPGHLTWARGSAPSPAGPISVELTEDELVVDSPVPFEHAGRSYPQGRRVLVRPTAPG